MNQSYLIVSSDSLTDDCSICLEELKVKKVIGYQKVAKTDCNHFFHQFCLETWLKKQQSCPICRTDINSTAKSVTCTIL